jgi:Domain of unknown function (DUF5916)
MSRLATRSTVPVLQQQPRGGTTIGHRVPWPTISDRGSYVIWTRHPAALGLAAAVVAFHTAPVRGQRSQDPGWPDPGMLPRPEARVLPSGVRLTVDGRLDEAAWSLAPPITEFVQAQPETGAPATERTVVRLLYDRDRLYIGAICYDSDPNGLVIKTLEHDYPGVLSEDMDSFGFSLDTFLDRRNSFLFFINPRGGLKDGQSFNDGTTRDYGWDAIIDVRTAVHDSGWSVEVAIPWTTLRFDPTRENQSWGANFLRRIRRKNEVSYWAPLERRDRIFLMSQAGTLQGLPKIRAGRNLTVKPFVLAGRTTGDSLQTEDRGTEADAGVDLKYGITPRITLDLSYRTDFSDADVDAEQVNLTRFPTFFPEQREFFLENSGIFTLGDASAPGAPRTGTSMRDFVLFHSRTIGLRNRRPVPLFGGARVTGRAESFEFGLLDVQSESFNGDPAENFSALRLRRNILGNSDVGVLVTNRQTTGAGDDVYNRSVGGDVNMRLAQSLFVNSYVAVTDADGVSDEAARMAVGWRDRVWDASAMMRHVGTAFEPGMGFISRTGIRQWYATFGAHPRPPVAKVLEVNPYAEIDYITDLDGDRVSSDGALGFGVTFEDGGSLSLQYHDRRERLDLPFRVRPEATIPVGDYHYREASASYQSSEGRSLSGRVAVSGGGYFNGSRFSLSGSTSWQPDYHLTIEGSATHNALTIDGTDFTADLYSARIKYAYSTTLYLGAFVQYNADVDQVVTNVRANLIHAPLSDFFLVFTERRDVGAGIVLERVLTAKVTKLLAF